MREDMDEQLPSGFKRSAHFCKEEFIILHVFEEFDGEDAVVC